MKKLKSGILIITKEEWDKRTQGFLDYALIKIDKKHIYFKDLEVLRNEGYDI